MISGTYTTIKLGGEITAEFGISYSNQILSSYVLFREHGRYMSLLDIKKNSGINWRRYTEKKSLRSKLKML